MRQSKSWQAARLIKDKKSKYATFTAIRNEFGFTSSSISAFATACKSNADWKGKLSANETQKIAETAFSATEDYCYNRRGKPRVKNVSVRSRY